MKTFTSVAQMKLAYLASGQLVETSGYYTPGDGGHGRYLIKPSEAVDGYGNHSLAGGTVAILQPKGTGAVNPLQFGAKADSALLTQGTDNTDNFQAAIDSNIPVKVDGGHFSIEGLLSIISDGASEGGKSFLCSSTTRLERFGAAYEGPMIQSLGSRNYVNGGNALLVARNVAKTLEGLLLYGVNPTETDNDSTGAGPMYDGECGNFKILGKSSNTGYNGSVGFYVNAAARKRGIWKTGGNSCVVYYNRFPNITVQQFDFPVHVSSEASFNTFPGLIVKEWGHAAVSDNGYGNRFPEFINESPLAQDSTERYVVYWGKKNDPFGPETGTDDSAVTVAITGITKAVATEITAVGHGLSTADTVKLDGIVDDGPNGDLEDALNEGHFQITVLDVDTFTIPLDTTGDSASYVSGGVVIDSFLPTLGAKDNYISGSAEWGYNASTTNVRLQGQGIPKGVYDVLNIKDTYDRNQNDILGVHPGGQGTGGFSTYESIGNNDLNTSAIHAERSRVTDFHGWIGRQLDVAPSVIEDTGSGRYGYASRSSVGMRHYKVYEGTTRRLVQSTEYDIITIDNIGPGTSGVKVKLDFIDRETSNNDMYGGEMAWLCSITNDTERVPNKYKDLVTSENGIRGVYSMEESVGSLGGTYAKFTLKLNTNAFGAGETCYSVWKAEVMVHNVDYDWDANVTIQNGD